MAINVGSNALASDFIVTSSGGTSSGKVPKLESDGRISNTFFKKFKISTVTSYSVEIALNFANFEQYEATAQNHAVSFATPVNMGIGREMTVSLKMVSDRAYSDTDNFFYTSTPPTTLEKDYVYLFTIKRISSSGYAVSWSRYLYINKSIKFVGSNTQIGSVSSTISLTALTGGIGSSAIEGDIVMILVSSTDNAQTISMVTGGFTQLDIQRNSNDTRNTASAVFYKVMTGFPNATVNVSSTGSYAIIAYVLRGVNTSTPTESTTVGTTGVDSNLVNSPAISTPTTSGAYILTLGAGSSDTNAATRTGTPSGFTNSVFINSQVGNVVLAVCASARWTPESPAGVINPSNFSFSDGGSSESFSAFTIALKPADE
jgi:hypothetical protein